MKCPINGQVGKRKTEISKLRLVSSQNGRGGGGRAELWVMVKLDTLYFTTLREGCTFKGEGLNNSSS